MCAGPTTCKLTMLGTEYVGTLNKTSSGKLCQAWTAQSPQKPNPAIVNSDFPDGLMAASENYCRNPPTSSGANGPWCYTMVPGTRWEYCNVPFCRKSSWHAHQCAYMNGIISLISSSP